jgi:hypothetical protein
LLKDESTDIKAIQEEICSEPTYNTSNRKCLKYTKEIDLYLDEILAE